MAFTQELFCEGFCLRSDGVAMKDIGGSWWVIMLLVLLILTEMVLKCPPDMS